MEINFEKVQEKKEMLAVLKASVVNGEAVTSEILGIYENEEELKRDKKNLDLDGHKTVVKVNVSIEPVEYLGDVDNIK